MHDGRPPVSIGVEGYPVFPGDPRLEIQLALNECLAAIEQDYMEHLQRCWSPDPAVSVPAKAEPYHERSKAEGAVLRAFIEGRADEWPALFHAALDRVLWLNFSGYAWESSCEAVEAIEREFYEQNPEMRPGSVWLQVAFPEGETPVWVNTLKFEGRSVYSFSSDAQYHGGSHIRRHDLHRVLTNLLGRKVAWSAGDIARMLETVASEHVYQWMLPTLAVLRVVGRYVEGNGMGREVRELLGRVKAKHSGRFRTSASDVKIVAQVEKILGEAPEPDLLEPGERWADAARMDLDAMAAPEREAWTALLRHAGAGKSARPSGRWAARARVLVEGVGAGRFGEHVARWFALVGQPGAGPPRGSAPWVRDATLISERSADLLCGLARCCGLADDRGACRAIAALAESCFHKVPGIGARSGRVGNACLAALGGMAGTEPVAWLVRLRSQVKYADARRRIDAILAGAAARAGMSAEDLEEVSVPGLGLEEGRLRRTLGNYTAEARFASPGRLDLRWLRQDGSAQKTVPAEVRRDHAVAWKDLKREVSDVERLFAAQCDRVERLMTAGRTWSPSIWRERYLDHPLLSTLSRRLIWRFTHGDRSRLGCWRDGRLVDDRDHPLDLEGPGGATAVSLWHPIDSGPEEVLRWRAWLEGHEVTQPFKQAHREVYLLTDAERSTRTYSNRFAAHVLKQHQLAALCRQRGWTYALQGNFDSHNVPALALPRWGLRGEFWVEGPGDRGDLSPAGIYLHVTTDQVRFYRAEARDPLPLEDVPPLAFSELMRDVDLFVGVASVANDPQWRDGGEAGAYRDYWDGHAFGDLSATAQTRREVLSRLIPRLKIASRCTLVDRFLVVRGDLRTYKIHLGSGNILMEPNDQYLCIVPDRGASSRGADGVFLPFEGDHTLALILSKALLLAEDRKIKDETIRRQIDPGHRSPQRFQDSAERSS
jgi:hypothetical protein